MTTTAGASFVAAGGRRRRPWRHRRRLRGGTLRQIERLERGGRRGPHGRNLRRGLGCDRFRRRRGRGASSADHGSSSAAAANGRPRVPRRAVALSATVGAAARPRPAATTGAGAGRAGAGVAGAIRGPVGPRRRCSSPLRARWASPTSRTAPRDHGVQPALEAGSARPEAPALSTRTGTRREPRPPPQPESRSSEPAPGVFSLMISRILCLARPAPKSTRDRPAGLAARNSSQVLRGEAMSFNSGSKVLP